MIRYLFLFYSLVTHSILTHAQQKNYTDFHNEISQYDLSVMWTTDNYKGVWHEGEEARQRSEPHGFIGEGYQRFYIHITTAIKNPDDPNIYLLYGKTRVKNTVCCFIGFARVTEAKLNKDYKVRGYYEGYAVNEIILYEDSKQASTGIIKGKLVSKFMMNDKGFFGYSGMHYISDGFKNNQFTGIWTSYKNGAVKMCHWGDGRIPDCDDLDIGAGEFSVNEKYIKNGWESYMRSLLGEPDDPTLKKAREEENRKWWKD